MTLYQLLLRLTINYSTPAEATRGGVSCSLCGLGYHLGTAFPVIADPLANLNYLASVPGSIKLRVNSTCEFKFRMLNSKVPKKFSA